MNTIYLVRHGENPANITREFSYRLVDYSLTPKGVEQSRQTAEYFRDIGVDEIYSSPLKRAKETADEIAKLVGREVVVRECLREINVGALEGQPPTDDAWRFHDQIIDDWYDGRLDVTFPEGESFRQLRDRAVSCLESIVRGKQGRRIVFVSHGGIITALVRALCADDDLGPIHRTGHPNCAITELEVSLVDGRLVGKVWRWADCAHLRH